MISTGFVNQERTGTRGTSEFRLISSRAQQVLLNVYNNRKCRFALASLTICVLMLACKGGGVQQGQTSPSSSSQTSQAPQLISSSVNGGIANGPSLLPAMSDDGRFVSFTSQASNLLMQPTPRGIQSIYVHDTCRNAEGNCAPGTSLVAVAENGGIPNGACGTSAEQAVAMSTEGRYYAFACLATNMVLRPNNGHSQVLVRDTCLNGGVACVPQTILVSQNSLGAAGNQDSEQVAISPNGRFVVFTSSATNLIAVPNVPASVIQVYLRDTCNGLPANSCTPQTALISQSFTGIPANFSPLSGSVEPWVDASGRFVVFASGATNLDPRATATLMQVYVRDTCGFPPTSVPSCTPSTQMAVPNILGNEPTGSTSEPEISPDGRYIVFASDAPDLLNGGPVLNGRRQVFIRDTCFAAPGNCAPQNTLISIGTDGTSGNDDSFFPSISSNARFVGWNSKATNLNANARASLTEAFVRDTCLGAQGCTSSTQLLSKNLQGQEANRDTSLSPSKVRISTDGNVAAFASSSTNLTPNATGLGDIFLILQAF